MKKLELIPLLAVVFVVAIGIWVWRSPHQSTTKVNLPSEPSSTATAQIQTTIRDFMADQSLEIKYISTSSNPSNFTIGKATQLGDGGSQIDTPTEWKRPVYVFQQTQYINERCEVYEYELDARNLQIVDIHVRYPEEIQNLLGSATGLNAAKCASYGSMELPLKSKDTIEQTAFDYLARGVGNQLPSANQFDYIPSKQGASNPAANEWIWQDTSYRLPDGLTGDVYNYPTIRIIVSSGGKLLHYFNSVGLFQS
jgi:hypothetical protein